MSIYDHHAPDNLKRQLRRCAHCGRPIWVNDGHRDYGSDACKQAAYRRRKAQARVTSDRP